MDELGLNFSAWWLVGGAAAAGTIVTLWGQIKGFLSQLRGRLIITINIEYRLRNAMATYIWHHLTTSRFGTRTYDGRLRYVRRHDRRELIAYEILGIHVFFSKAGNRFGLVRRKITVMRSRLRSFVGRSTRTNSSKTRSITTTVCSRARELRVIANDIRFITSMGLLVMVRCLVEGMMNPIVLLLAEG